MKTKNIISIIILIVAAAILLAGSNHIIFNEDSFTVKSGFATETVSYEGITEVEYRDVFDVGGRKVGSSTVKLLTGTFNNEEFGDYRLYIYKQIPAYIIIYEGEEVTVVNLATEEDTMEAYNTISAMIDKKTE